MSSNKSFSTETSERYGLALFEVAKEDNELDKIENDVKNFQSIFQKYPEIKNFLDNPTLSLDSQNKFINLLVENLTYILRFQFLLFL